MRLLALFTATVGGCNSGHVTNRPVVTEGAVPAAGLLATTSVLGFVLVYVLTVRTIPGRQFGDVSLRGALITNAALVDSVDAVLGVVSVASLLAGVAGVALIALVRLRRAQGLAAVGLLVAANVSTLLLKGFVLNRPDLGLQEITPATHNSLPSGHTTAVFSVVVALMLVVPARARSTVAVGGGAAAVVIALATMSAGWHRAGDSIAALLLVGALAGVGDIATTLSTRSAPIRRAPAREGARVWRRRLLLTVVGSTGSGCFLALALVVIPGLRANALGEVGAFLAGGLLIVAAAIAVLLGELVVLERSDP